MNYFTLHTGDSWRAHGADIHMVTGHFPFSDKGRSDGESVVVCLLKH